MSRIVVGVTQSHASRNALRWAFQMAAAKGATLSIVTAFDESVGTRERPLLGLSRGQPERRRMQIEQLAVLLDELGDAVLQLRCAPEVVEGKPAPALCARSMGADLLVIGRRSTRWPRSRGTIEASCVKWADCPVVTVSDAVEIESVRIPLGSWLARRALNPSHRHHTRMVGAAGNGDSASLGRCSRRRGGM